jgi:hypothetical protein
MGTVGHDDAVALAARIGEDIAGPCGWRLFLLLTCVSCW